MAYDDSNSSLYQTTGLQTLKGDTGPQGVQGVPGVPGNTIWNGTGAPASTLGLPGDFYIDTTNFLFWGPKTFSGWPASGVSTRGPQGNQGTQGNQGGVGPAGPLPFQTPAVPWAAGVTYTASAPASLVTYQNIVYLCTVSHVSQSTFGSANFQPLTGAPSYDSVTLTTSAKAPTVAAGDNSTNISTTAYADRAVATETARAAAKGANSDITSLTALASIASRPTINGNTLFDTGNVTLSKATNGYIKLPNGLIIQWGLASGTSSGNNGTSFNVGFPTACCMVVGQTGYNPGSGTANAVSVSIYGVGPTGFSWSSRYYNGGYQADNNALYWMAIGY